VSVLACASTFSRFARRSLTLRPTHSRCHQFVTRITKGFSHFVTSMTAPVASGWSGCLAGLAPAGKKTPPFHGAHPERSFGAARSQGPLPRNNGHSWGHVRLLNQAGTWPQRSPAAHSCTSHKRGCAWVRESVRWRIRPAYGRIGLRCALNSPA
jgi:hypothetical protein